jgi:hypothetical protein
MKKLAICLGLLLVLTVTVVPAGAITWGDPDTEHTNVGAMVVDWPGYGPVQMCSGTLIHPQVFLTAGHCTTGLEDGGITTVWVNFDVNALNEDTLLDVAEVITHPDYNWGPLRCLMWQKSLHIQIITGGLSQIHTTWDYLS